jgi:diguanylate cyclase (GGDEF)-like protein
MNSQVKPLRTAAQDSFELYLQLIRSLLPRTSSVAIFDGAGDLLWANDSMIDPDLFRLVAEALSVASVDAETAGQLRQLPGVGPTYLFWLRDERGKLALLVAVGCRRLSDGEQQSFGFVHGILRPALECMRREFTARSSISQLRESLAARDKDLELLLSVSSEREDAGGEDLKSLLRNATAHLRCALSAIIVPEKGLVQVHADPNGNADTGIVAKTHRQLISLTQTRREPVIINRVAGADSAARVPYRIVACPIRLASGRPMGVLALYRHEDGVAFVERDAHLADLLARKVAAAIESSYDSLSGLLTRGALEQRVRAARIDESSLPSSSSLLYIDIDQLHVINESLGMHIGDKAIAQIGDLMRKRLPPGAVAARISGDRFAVLLPSAMQEAQGFAESLREGVAQLLPVSEGARVQPTISVGIAPFAYNDRDISHPLAEAESACKAAKDRGRNRVELFQDADLSIVRRFTDINIASDVRVAINEGRLRLDAQTIMPLSDAHGSRPHFELLLRMFDRDGTTVGPERFLSAAQRYQMMPTIDRWVISEALRLLGPHADVLAGGAVVFAINLSGQSIGDASFQDFVIEQIEASGIDPTVFCFELTESAAVASIEATEGFMRRLRKLGCGVALDDFGTGQSSLSYLRSLPVTLLKIDGSFVRDILKDPRAESMVRAIAQLASSMGIATCAEYVETDELLRRVATLGVDYGQGFAIRRPVPFAEVLEEIPVLAAASPVPMVDPDSDSAVPALVAALQPPMG